MRYMSLLDGYEFTNLFVDISKHLIKSGMMDSLINKLNENGVAGDLLSMTTYIITATKKKMVILNYILQGSFLSTYYISYKLLPNSKLFSVETTLFLVVQYYFISKEFKMMQIA